MLSAVTSLCLPRPLSVNSLYGQRAGRQRYKTKSYKAWSDKAQVMLAEQEFKKTLGPYWLRITMRRYGNSGDVGNYEKCISDALVEAGAVEDDKLAEAILVEWGEPGAGNACLCEIYDSPPEWIERKRHEKGLL